MRLGQDHFHSFADDSAFQSRAVPYQGQHFGVDRNVVVGGVVDAHAGKLSRRLQIRQELSVEFAGFDLAHGLAAAADARVLGFGRGEAGFVDCVAAFFRHIFGDLNGQAERGFQIKGVSAGQRTTGVERGKHVIQFVEAAIHRAVEALLFQRDHAFDVVGFIEQLAEMLAHHIKYSIGDLRQEGSVETDLPAETGRAPDDNARDGGCALWRRDRRHR